MKLVVCDGQQNLTSASPDKDGAFFKLHPSKDKLYSFLEVTNNIEDKLTNLQTKFSFYLLFITSIV